MKHDEHKFHKRKRTPLWKWLVIILLILAIPLFFLFARNVQLQEVLTNLPNNTQGR